MFRLAKLQIDNFKSISKEIILDFRDLDMVVFDGPNGFGKTTLFDAVEISFTGGISRIDAAGGATDSKAKNNHLLKNVTDRKTEILLELSDTLSSEVYTIRSVIEANIKGTKASVRDYKSSIVRHYKCSSHVGDEWFDLEQGFIENLIGLKSLASLFHIQHYIQQEETSGFLKKNNEGNRHKQLSHLFGTSLQTNDLLKLERLKKVLEVKIKSHKESVGLIDAQLQAIKPSEIDQRESNLSPSGVLALPESLAANNLTPEGYSSLVDSINGLLFFVKNPNVYKALKFNHIVDFLLDGRDQQLNDLLCLGMATDYSDIERLHRSRAKHQKLRTRLDLLQDIYDAAENDNQSLSVDFLDLMSKEFPPGSLIIGRLAELQNERAHNQGLNAILVRMTSSRKSLLEAYEKFQSENSDSPVNCPLCGAVKESGIVQLIQEIEQHQKVLMEQASTGTLTITALKNNIAKHYIEPAIKRCSFILGKYKKYRNESVLTFFDKKAIDPERFSNFRKVQVWLDNAQVKYKFLVDDKITDLSSNYPERCVMLRTAINQLKKPIDSDTPSLKSVRESLRYFDLGEEAIGSIKEGDLLKDLQYVLATEKNHTNSIYSNSSQKKLLLSRKIDNLTAEKERLVEISGVYKQQIQKHESNIAAQIAIPFYIYSSKVLQTRPEGTGIFLRTPDISRNETVPYIRFCSNRSDEHDAWYTMSSGQLSGLIISFALSMNKIYPSKLKTILIDDPVQSMDEVNMASLIQLLKYEFQDHQLILSTHDTRISSYINYKLHRTGKAVERMNMKNLSKDFN